MSTSTSIDSTRHRLLSAVRGHCQEVRHRRGEVVRGSTPDLEEGYEPLRIILSPNSVILIICLHRERLTSRTMAYLVSGESRLGGADEGPGEVVPRPRTAGCRTAKCPEGARPLASGARKTAVPVHSNLVEFERGHRLAPVDVVEGYECSWGSQRGRSSGSERRVLRAPR